MGKKTRLANNLKKSNTSQILTDEILYSEKTGSSLDRRNMKKFKFAITGCLEEKYNFKKLNPSAIKKFHRFTDKIVSKYMTISSVEKTYLRTRGKPERDKVNGKDREILHFGKDNDSFRIHGYYNDEYYFVIYRIDPNHQKHKS